MPARTSFGSTLRRATIVGLATAIGLAFGAISGGGGAESSPAGAGGRPQIGNVVTADLGARTLAPNSVLRRF
jgi:hypothetical protein